MNLIRLVLDFESFYSDEYSLRRKGVTLTSYINDLRFKAHGAGIIINDSAPVWITGAELQPTLNRIPWNRTVLIGHNLKFDAAILRWRYGISPALMIDTKSISRALLGNIPDSFTLDELGNYLLGEGKIKGLEDVKGVYNLTPELEYKLSLYCLRDCVVTKRICDYLLPYFPKDELKNVDSTIRMFTEPVLELDKQRLLDYRVEVLRKKEALLAALNYKYGLEVFRSNEKFADVLRNLGVEPPLKPSSSNPDKLTYAFAKTDEDFLALQEHDDPEVSLVVQARLGIKTSIEETRAASYAAHADYGPWPVDIEYCGALATHRYSGAKGGGGNPQNLKRKSEIRKSIKARKNYVCIVGDSSSVELRVAMGFAGQRNIVDLLRTGGDVYCNFASDLFQRTITKQDETERFLGKLACLSLQYGAGHVKFLNIAGLNKVKLTLEGSKNVVDTYRRVMHMIPYIWKVLNGVIPAMANGVEVTIPPTNIISVGLDPFFLEKRQERVPCLFLPGGLRIRYPGLRRDSNGQWVYMTRTHRTAHEAKLYGGKLLENICQALAGRIVNWQAAQYTKETGYRVALTVHDEIVSCVREEDADRCLAAKIKWMSTPPPWWQDLPVSCEVKAHEIYGMAK